MKSLEIGRTVIGKVIRINTFWKAAKISAQRMVLDPYTNVYINRASECWASDPQEQCQIGDLILIMPLEKQERFRVSHYVKKIIFPVGNIVDPITGKRCRGTEFIDESQRNFKQISS